MCALTTGKALGVSVIDWGGCAAIACCEGEIAQMMYRWQRHCVLLLMMLLPATWRMRTAHIKILPEHRRHVVHVMSEVMLAGPRPFGALFSYFDV